jgi:RNA polymerase sigma factor (sigma-70 family)
MPREMRGSADRPDGDTLAALLESMRPRLRAILTRHAIPPADAEDLLQDSFLALCVSWERIENREAWVSGTLRFLCCSYWRKKKRQSFESIDAATIEGLPDLAALPQSRSDVLLDLEALVAKLTPRYRHLLRLRYGLGMSSAELTARLGYTADHVRKLTSRALARARSLGEEAQRPPLKAVKVSNSVRPRR